MQQFGRWRFSPIHALDAMHAYSKMHVGYGVQVEWGIGGFSNGEASWNIFIQQNPNIVTCSKLQLFWLISCINAKWTSQMKSLGAT
jgi:hypothetical protein